VSRLVNARRGALGRRYRGPVIGVDDDEKVLAPRMRALAIVPALVFCFAVVDAAVWRAASGHLLWVCHVAAPLLAVGLALSNAPLVRIAFAPACLALPLGIAGLVDADVGVSLVAALALPPVATAGLRAVGVDGGLIRWTLGALAFVVVVAVVGAALSDPQLNVNLVDRAPAGLGLSGIAWWPVLLGGVTLTVHGLHAGASRALTRRDADKQTAAPAPAATTNTALPTRNPSPSRSSRPALRVSRASEVEPLFRAGAGTDPGDGAASPATVAPSTAATAASTAAAARGGDGTHRRDEIVRPKARTSAGMSSSELAAALAEVRRPAAEPSTSVPVAYGLGMAAPVPLPPPTGSSLPLAPAAGVVVAPSTPLPGSVAVAPAPFGPSIALAPVVPVLPVAGEAVVAGPAVPVPVAVGGDIIRPAVALSALDPPTEQTNDRRTEENEARSPSPGTDADDAPSDLDAPTVTVATTPGPDRGNDDEGSSDLDAPTVATQLPPPGAGTHEPDDGDDALDAPTVAIEVLTRQRKDTGG
jgi:hypothetical protein